MQYKFSSLVRMPLHCPPRFVQLLTCIAIIGLEIDRINTLIQRAKESGMHRFSEIHSVENYPKINNTLMVQYTWLFV